MSETTRHLPECPSTSPDPLAADCCCARLHAVERRVRMEDDDYAYVAVQAEAGGRRRGWNEALDEARAAVAALPPTGIWATDVSRTEALAAIDALKEKQ